MSLTKQLCVGDIVTYLDIIVAQETELPAAIAAAQTRTAWLHAPTNLPFAVGGGWGSPELSTERGALRFEPINVFHYDREPRPDGTGLQHADGRSEHPRWWARARSVLAAKRSPHASKPQTIHRVRGRRFRPRLRWFCNQSIGLKGGL